MKATQEVIEGTKDMHVLTASQGQASAVLSRDPKVTYKETIGALEDQFWDHQLDTGYRNQLKTQTQDEGQPLQEFATTIEQLTHCAFPALQEDHI
jgi:hypothetical protein